MPYGVGWGASPWGGGAGEASEPGDFYIVGARAVASNVVRVTFSLQPLFKSPLGANDAANLANWGVTLTETGEALMILAARAVPGDAFSIELVMLKPWASALYTYAALAANIIPTSGSFVLDNPAYATFLGLPAAALTSNSFVGVFVDVRNPQATETGVNGALNVTTAGDYELESGITLLKKLIIRRLLTTPGEFLHLPKYGLGLTPSALYVASDLVRLKKEIERQVLLEPEVLNCAVGVSLERDGRLNVRLRAALRRTGQEFSFSLPLQSGGQFNLQF